MTKTEILAILKDFPEARFTGPYKGFYSNPVWDPNNRYFMCDHVSIDGRTNRLALTPRRAFLYSHTLEQFQAKRDEEVRRANEEVERAARKKAVREKEAAFLKEHEHEIRSSIGRVLGVRPEDISTDKHRGTVSISVSATVALLMLDRVSR